MKLAQKQTGTLRFHLKIVIAVFQEFTQSLFIYIHAAYMPLYHLATRTVFIDEVFAAHPPVF